MWLSERVSRAKPMADTASVGDVTYAAEEVGVMLDGERRALGLAAPGGYFWRPRKDEGVLVVKGLDGENLISALPQNDMPSEIEGGEILIRSAGGMSVKLTNGGDIILSGKIRIDGEVHMGGGLIVDGGLIVGGVPYKPCKCE